MKRLALSSLALAFTLSALSACDPALPTLPPGAQLPPARAEQRAVHVREAAAAPSGDAALADAAVEYVRARKALVALGAGDDVSVTSIRTGAGGVRHVRTKQTWNGIEVWGSDLVVHATDSEFDSLSGNLTVGLQGLDPTPAVDPSVALLAAKGDYATKAKTADEPLVFSREKNQLVVFPTSEGGARLAWHVEFYTEMQNGITPGLWNYFIDAKSGEIVEAFNAIHTVSQASGAGGNAKVGRAWTNALDVEPDPANASVYMMHTSGLQTVTMGNLTSGTGTVVKGPLGAIGDAAVNDAHGFSEIVLNMMKDWMGYDSIDGNGFRIRSRVHYSTGYENAFWDGTQMTYGDGAATFYPLSGDLDVVSHEIAHGFTERHSALVYSAMSGGINESFSDVAGTAAEFFHEGTAADWDIGRDIFKDANGALRYMCNPPQDGASIDHASKYASGMDVHYSSGVFNKAFCLASRRIASGTPTGAATAASVRMAAKAWYEANDNYWTGSTSFTQGCQGVLDAGKALGYAAPVITAITSSFADTGVYCGAAEAPPTCDETFTAASGTITSPGHPNPYPNNYTRTSCIQAPGAATLTFNVMDTQENVDFVTIFDANANEVAKVSGTTKAAVTSAKIYLRFKTDGSGSASGWSARWTSSASTNQPPTVQLTAPAHAATVSGIVTVSATAMDPEGQVSRVTFGLPDGTTVKDTTAPYAISWNTATVADGETRAITAWATDGLGLKSETAIRVVKVQNGASCATGTFQSTGGPVAIPDSNSSGILSPVTIAGAGLVQSLALTASISHPYKPDLKVILIAPDGTQETVHNRTGTMNLTNRTVSSFTGKPSAGLWRLWVQDLDVTDAGTLDSWSLTLTGACDGATPTPVNWSGSASPNTPLVDNGTTCSTLTVTGAGNAADVQLDVSGTHEYRTSLRGTLTHKGLTMSAFPTGTFAASGGPFSTVGRSVPGFTGTADGEWKLCITDTDAHGDIGKISAWSVHN